MIQVAELGWAPAKAFRHIKAREQVKGLEDWDGVVLLEDEEGHAVLVFKRPDGRWKGYGRGLVSFGQLLPIRTIGPCEELKRLLDLAVKYARWNYVVRSISAAELSGFIGLEVTNGAVRIRGFSHKVKTGMTCCDGMIADF